MISVPRILALPLAIVCLVTYFAVAGVVDLLRWLRSVINRGEAA
jgi:hypothetical protein